MGMRRSDDDWPAVRPVPAPSKPKPSRGATIGAVIVLTVSALITLAILIPVLVLLWRYAF